MYHTLIYSQSTLRPRAPLLSSCVSLAVRLGWAGPENTTSLYFNLSCCVLYCIPLYCIMIFCIAVYYIVLYLYICICVVYLTSVSVFRSASSCEKPYFDLSMCFKESLTPKAMLAKRGNANTAMIQQNTTAPLHFLWAPSSSEESPSSSEESTVILFGRFCSPPLGTLAALAAACPATGGVVAVFVAVFAAGFQPGRRQAQAS